MAGTDQTKSLRTDGPAVILVAPQLGENIGTSARAMLNCGLTDLRLVRPRDGWPSDKARSAASGADQVIEGARVFGTTAEAIADLTFVCATTARDRAMNKPVLTPREAASDIVARGNTGERIGLMFGGERAGLDNDDVALADIVLTAPLNPAYRSLNLAQAVLLVAHEVFVATDDADTAARARNTDTTIGPAAPKHLLMNLFEHLEQELDEAGFFRVDEKRPSMVRNLRTLIARAEPNEQEVRTLHGIVTALSGRRKDGRPRTGVDGHPSASDVGKD